MQEDLRVLKVPLLEVHRVLKECRVEDQDLRVLRVSLVIKER